MLRWDNPDSCAALLSGRDKFFWWEEEGKGFWKMCYDGHFWGYLDGKKTKEFFRMGGGGAG